MTVIVPNDDTVRPVSMVCPSLSWVTTPAEVQLRSAASVKATSSTAYELMSIPVWHSRETTWSVRPSKVTSAIATSRMVTAVIGDPVLTHWPSWKRLRPVGQPAWWKSGRSTTALSRSGWCRPSYWNGTGPAR